MVLLSSPVCDFGTKMPKFVLKDLDGIFFDSTEIENYDAILVFFICKKLWLQNSFIEKDKSKKLINII